MKVVTNLNYFRMAKLENSDFLLIEYIVMYYITILYNHNINLYLF